MFTGIVTDLGEVTSLTQAGDLTVRIASRYEAESIDIGASIACAGVCLTVVERGAFAAGEGPGGRISWFDMQVSAETVGLTNLGSWQVGTVINLERALRLGDELGGHIVSGHVDGLARIVELRPDGDSTRFEFEAPEALAKFIAPKGSVALDGTSLTVNAVEGRRFGVNIIPHTKAVTSWGQAQAGDLVNLEIDTLARYVARLAEAG